MSTDKKRKLDIVSNTDTNNTISSDVESKSESESKSKSTTSYVNEYKSQCDFHEVDIISSNISSEHFYKQYITKRIPVKFNNFITDKEFNIQNFTLNHLKTTAGDGDVRVEYRKTINDNYGEGNEIYMKFHEFLTKIETNSKESELYYLTAQELEYDVENKPSLYSTPITELIEHKCIPMKPGLVGELDLDSDRLSWSF